MPLLVVTLFLALRCPSGGCFGDGVGGHAVDMSQPSACLHNLCLGVHSYSISQFFVRDGVGSVNPENASKAICLDHL